MKLLLSLAFLLLLSQASTSTPENLDDEEDRTDESRLVTSVPDYHDNTNEPINQETVSPRRLCRPLTNTFHLHPSFGESVSLNCSCSMDSIQYYECPEWRGVYNTLHTYTRDLRRGICTVTLNIKSVNHNTPVTLTCADITSHRKTEVVLHYEASIYGGRCEHTSDCSVPFTCVDNGAQNKTCNCPITDPIPFGNLCYPVVNLLNPCKFSAQCKAWDRNSYCMKSDVNNTGEQYCLCGPGYELGNDGRCICEDCGLNYVYRFSKRYQIIFYCLLSISILLILLGLLRVCLVSRRSNLTGIPRPGVIVSTRPEDSSPLTDVKQPKEKV